MTSSGTELATFRLAAWCLNELSYHVPIFSITHDLLLEKMCKYVSSFMGKEGVYNLPSISCKIF
jgi:hypothetical protein